MNRRKIYRQGNSLVVALPPALLTNMDLQLGDYLLVCDDKQVYLTLNPVYNLNGKWVRGNPRRSDQ